MIPSELEKKYYPWMVGMSFTRNGKDFKIVESKDGFVGEEWVTSVVYIQINSGQLFSSPEQRFFSKVNPSELTDPNFKSIAVLVPRNNSAPRTPKLIIP